MFILLTFIISTKAQRAQNEWTPVVNNLTVPIYWKYNNNNLIQTQAPVNGNKATADACIVLVGNQQQLIQGIRCCGVFPQSDGTERFLLNLLPLNLQGLILQAGNSVARRTLFNYCICGCALRAAPNGQNTALLCRGPAPANRRPQANVLNQVLSPPDSSFTCLSNTTYNLLSSVTPYTDQCLIYLQDSITQPYTYPYARHELQNTPELESTPPPPADPDEE